MKFIKIIRVLLPLLLIFILAVGCSDNAAKENSEKITYVKTQKVNKEVIALPVKTSGKISSTAETKLSFKTGGIINDIKVREGQSVDKGQVLAVLDLKEIKARFNQAKDGLDKAKRDYERVKKLYDDEVATLEQLQDAETSYNVALSNLEIAEFNLQYSKIVAPADGKILAKFVEENELVGQGKPIFLFGINGKGWKVKVGVTDKDIIKLKIGDAAKVTFDAYPGVEFEALVNEVGEFANPYNGTYEVELVITLNEYKLVSGFVAKVEIYPSDRKSYLMVPYDALVEANNTDAFIYTVENSRAKKLPVKVRHITQEFAAVDADKNNIGEVIIDGSAYLSNNVLVQVVNR
ncbi:MAG: efflux RND transporter periplasmic adaptor subunit [Ignavibacteria bacterium]